tara:strand:+ start:616 stop:1686 length:1071 start_codon:yes stop_codon:yes gene_type:complete
MESIVIEKPIDQLLERIPLDAKREVLKFISQSTEHDEHFMDRLGSYESIEELQADYQDEMADEFSKSVFLIQPKGLGMGEVWIAWLVKGAVISGGGESFDVLSNGTQYEAKAYNFFPHYKTKELQLGKYEGVWRLGNAGAMSNFSFMKHLTHAVDLCAELSKITNPEGYHITEALRYIDLVEKGSLKYGMAADFSRGEIGKKKMANIIMALHHLHIHVSQSRSDYDIVTFGSSSIGNPNISYLIENATQEEISQGKIKIVKSIDETDITVPLILNRMLVKSKYIREGASAIIEDINNDIAKVQSKYEGINFIVFRKSGMNIQTQLRTIEGNNIDALLSAIGNVFNVSSASVRLREI